MARLKAQVGSASGLHDVVLNNAASWYAQVPPAFLKADPMVLTEARKLSKGNWQKCIVDRDGSIIVCRTVVWSK